MITENFLQFIWRHRRFDAQSLTTTDGQPLEIAHPGDHNTDAGPDFFNARIRLGDTLWAGNVEVHCKSSEWLLHGHELDKAYDNVILHVVGIHDAEIVNSEGRLLPVLELLPRIAPDVLDRHAFLFGSQDVIACGSRCMEVPEMMRLNWLDRMLVERLEQKTAWTDRALAQTVNHYDETFYRVLAHSFGLKINTQPFELLAESLPLKILSSHSQNPLQIEALLFGQAGFLAARLEDDYMRTLEKEYRFLQHKYGLTPIKGVMWKFMRLRPAAFPTIRIALFAALIHRSAHLWESVLAATSLRDLEHLFEVEVGGYWEKRFIFGPPGRRRPKSAGKDFIHSLLINTVCPMLFTYGKMKDNPDIKLRALHLLESLPPEKNALLLEWERLGMPMKSAFQTQALLQLRNQYCREKRCLQCTIGSLILRG